jgi:hypothetical protein
MREAGSGVVLVTDGCSDKCNEPFSHIGVILSNYKMLLLETVKHGVEKSIKDLNGKGIFVKGFISDNERKMISCRDQLQASITYNLKEKKNKLRPRLSKILLATIHNQSFKLSPRISSNNWSLFMPNISFFWSRSPTPLVSKTSSQRSNKLKQLINTIRN